MRWWLIGILGLIMAPATGQMSEGHRIYLNNQIEYINECIHGLLIAHRLFEGYNQEVNKYVDLASYEINHYGNQDLPSDLFADNSQQFYIKSPQALYKSILLDARRKQHPVDIWNTIAQIRNITEFVNQGRLELGQNVLAGNLNQLANIQKVYLGLESASEYYEDFSYQVDLLEKIFNGPYDQVNLSPPRQQAYTAMVDIYYDVKNALSQVAADRTSINNLVSKIEKEVNWLKTCIGQFDDAEEKTGLLNIVPIIESFVEELSSYANNDKVPAEYSQYRRGYYFHNVRLLSLVNRYGNGFVSECNKFFDRHQWRTIKFLEEPHFIQVIYPERIA